MAVVGGAGTIVTDGLILYLDAANPNSYPRSGTTWTDLSGLGYTGGIINGPVFSTTNTGIFSLDGTNDYIEINSPSDRWAWTPSGAGNNTLSLELWVKPSETAGLFISKPWNGSGQYNYYLDNTGFRLQIGNQNSTISYTPNLTVGKWEHIVCIVTSTQYAIYRDGILRAGFTNHNITNNTPTSGNNNLPLCLMTLYPYGTGTWSQPSFSIAGDISSFKIYNRVLSATEVIQNFNALRGRFGL